VGNRPAYGDVRLEAATFAVGQLDAAFSYHPPLSVWMFWGQFVASPHGLPLKVGATLSLAERGGGITALAYAVEFALLDGPAPGSGICSTVLSPT
jgi:hypothetical protein